MAKEFEETVKSHFKRIEGILNDMQYLTSCVRFAKDRQEEDHYLEKFEDKIEQLREAVDYAKKVPIKAKNPQE